MRTIKYVLKPLVAHQISSSKRGEGCLERETLLSISLRTTGPKSGYDAISGEGRGACSAVRVYSTWYGSTVSFLVHTVLMYLVQYIELTAIQRGMIVLYLYLRLALILYWYSMVQAGLS